jgi:microcystin-dependent protein
MSTPFLGEIKIVSFNFPPKGWAFCNGQLLPINQNQALFSILGTTYGGDGRVNFGLPDLRGRTPVHVGQGIILGERGGEEAHTLIISEMPAHNHPVNASSNTGSTPNPSNAFWAGTAAPAYGSDSLTAMAPQSISNTGGSQPHLNLSPYLVLNFCIALQGIFPSQN